MKVMERFGREARRSSMAAAATDGLSCRRERMSNKRRRGEETAGSMEEEDGCKGEVDDNMVLAQMSSSSSARRRNHNVVRGSKQDQRLEVIGVQVPRKARTASAKRSHENSSSGNDVVGKDQNTQKQNVEVRKKMKPIGAKNRLPKSMKLSSGPVEEDIENEIAEVLFGLMKQSQSSKDGDSVKSSTSDGEDEDKDRYSIRKDSKTSISEQETSHASDRELKNASKESNVIAEAVEVESNQQPKMETSSPNREPKSESVSRSIQLLEEEAKPFVEESVDVKVPQLELERKREGKFEFDLMASPPMEEDSASDNVAEAVLETLEDKKIEIISEKLDENKNQDSDTKFDQQPKAIISRLERSDWRSGLSATTLQPGSPLLSQTCAKRCATHHYIARNIYLHQKFTKTMNLLPAAAGSAPVCDTKPDIVMRNDILRSASGHSAKESKDRSSEAASKSKKPLAQQSPSQPASAGNLMHGSTLNFSLEKNQASVAATSDPSGPLKYGESTNNASHVSHSALSAEAAAHVCSPNVTFQESPYLAINGYSFPMTTSSGTTLTFQGGNSTQGVPLYKGPFYSNQMFHPSQLQQQPHSQFQHQIRSSHQKNTGMSTDSSSSHRQLESQQLQKTHFISMQSQQSQNKYVTQTLQPCKLEKDIIGGSTATSSQAQHSVYGYGQNFAMPVQRMNFTMMPYVTMSGGGSGNHIEQAQQQQDLKGVFGMSFGSIGENKGTGTLLNFASMPQNPAMYQNLTATQSAPNKNHQVSERKNGGSSDNPDHDKSKAVTGRSSSNAAQTLVFDNSATNLNFTALNSHQQHLYQFQLQQQQPVMVARSKAPKSTPVFSQALVQCSTSVHSHNNSGRSLTSQVPITTSTVNSFLQQQGRASQGQTQISFGGNPKSSLAVPQGQLTNPSLLTT